VRRATTIFVLLIFGVFLLTFLVINLGVEARQAPLWTADAGIRQGRVRVDITRLWDHSGQGRPAFGRQRVLSGSRGAPSGTR
jgi:hypothetical protein